MNCWVQAMNENNNVSIDHYKDTYLIKEQKIDRIFSDNTSINRFVISQAILKLLFLIRECHSDKSELIAYNTDGIYITNPKIKFKNKKESNLKQNISVMLLLQMIRSNILRNIIEKT